MPPFARMMSTPLRRCAASLLGGYAPCGRAKPVPRLPWKLWPLLLWVGASLAFAEAKVYEARVTRVSDGDTLWVQPLPHGRFRKLRLQGIDAPEMCQPGGTASRDALSARVLRQVVTVSERRRDDYGRALVKLQHEGEDVAAFMVRQGHAWSYRWRHSDGPYAREERQARAQRQGLFATAAPEHPRDFRRRHGPCPSPSR